MEHRSLLTYGIVAILINTNIAMAKHIEEGAYTSKFGDEKTYCISSQEFEMMQMSTWIEFMKKRGKLCTITEKNNPIPSISRREAECRKGSLASKKYEFQINRPGKLGNRVLLDSTITNSRGKIYLKKNFLGEYAGPCQNDLPRLSVESYFDLPSRGYEGAGTDARYSVAKDLIYCGVLSTSLSQISDSERSDNYSGLGTLFFKEARSLLDEDENRFNQETTSAINDIKKNTDNIELRIRENPRCKAFYTGHAIRESVLRSAIQRSSVD